MINNVSILGCGWLGFPLAVRLIKEGFDVKGSTTSPEKIDALKNAGISPFLIRLMPEVPAAASAFFNSKILVINIPPSRGAEKPDHISQIDSIINTAQSEGVEKIVFISSTSVYNENNSMVVEEDALNPVSPSGVLLLKAEELLTGSANFTTTVLRFGGLIGPGRNPGRFLAGRKMLPGGSTPVNLIHLDDCIEIIYQVIVQDAWGYILNAVSDVHPSKQVFYTRAASVLNLEPPEFDNQEQKYKIVDSTKLKKVLNYSFIHPDPLETLK